MSPHVELLEGESLMADAEELIYRQITKHMLNGEQVASTAYGPMPADKNMPSYSRGSVVTPQDARDWHTRHANSPSLGVRALTVGEVIVSLRYVVDDSEKPLNPGQPRAPGHCFVDYRGLSRQDRKTLNGKLWFFANARGEIETTETPGEDELEIDDPDGDRKAH